MNDDHTPCASQPDEHTLLCGYNKVRRYGTTQSSSTQFPRRYINYIVQPDDTLQGIALKNDCSVSSIVRANKLWSAEDLHLKTSIRIPVCDEIQREYGVRDGLCTQSGIPKSSEKKEDPSQESMKDILSRIDDVIKNTTTTVRKLEQESTLDGIDHFHDDRVPIRTRQISLQKDLRDDYYYELS
ncbi:LysM domain protein [Dictyocaulus viviparus]|uniref:LysM domain protein n=1 Tax=Dictyocaulus viviparus TaxID=29172 RepID=A0A0D8Y4K8_DICVI|nr:LysM domain protein [Dictyocaulus viviparus]